MKSDEYRSPHGGLLPRINGYALERKSGYAGRVRVEWRSFPKGECSVVARRGNVDCVCKQRGETPGEMPT